MYNKNETKRTQKNMNKIARNLKDLYAFYGKLRLNYINKNETFILIYTEQKSERICRHEEMNGLRKTMLKSLIGHFTVVSLVTWPLSGSEAGGDLVLIQTLLLFICNSKLVSMRTT